MAKKKDREDGSDKSDMAFEPAPQEPALNPLEAAANGDDGHARSSGENDVEVWKQRYQTLKGKYDAEVPRLYTQLDDMSEQFASLQTDLESLKKNPPANAPAASGFGSQPGFEYGAPNATSQPNESEDHLKREFPEIYDGVQALIKNSVTREIGSHIAPIRSNVDGFIANTQKERQEKFYQDLSGFVPDWRKINRSQEFIGWLSTADRFQTKSRRELLTDAFNELNSATVANFFKAFKEESPEEETPHPDTSGGGTPAPDKNTKDNKIKRSWINQFYNDLSANRYKGRDREVEKIIATIDRAAATGNIIDG